MGGRNVGSRIGGPALFGYRRGHHAVAAIVATAMGRPQERPVGAAAVTGRDRQSGGTGAGARLRACEAVRVECGAPGARSTTGGFDEEDEDDDMEEDDWSFLTFNESEDEPVPEPEPKPRPKPAASPHRRRGEPLRAVRSQPRTGTGSRPEASPRPRRDRPLRKGDASDRCCLYR